MVDRPSKTISDFFSYLIEKNSNSSYLIDEGLRAFGRIELGIQTESRRENKIKSWSAVGKTKIRQKVAGPTVAWLMSLLTIVHYCVILFF